MTARIRKGDRVIVTTGRDKGKKGEVLRVYPDDRRALVSGVNVVKRHQRQTQRQQGGIVNKEAPVTPVPFERILRADKEPQNWLTYSGGLMSQRHSGLSQITPDNAKDLTLKWVFQSRSIEKHEVTPLVVDGVMYTIQGINDVFALDASTGKTLWRYLYKPDPIARNCCAARARPTSGLPGVGVPSEEILSVLGTARAPFGC